jgi:hypothetical protein
MARTLGDMASFRNVVVHGYQAVDMAVSETPGFVGQSLRSTQP